MTLWDTIGNFFYEQSQTWLTMPRLFCFAAVIVGYFFGMFQSAFLIAKAMHVNIYTKGSGNAGTTNMLRVLGPLPGILTFLFDIGKAVAAVFLMKYVLIDWLHFSIDPIAVKLFTGLGVILGHNFPAYLKFKGGKGVAVTCTLFAVIGEWKYVITGLVVFGLIVLFTRYVSLASMATVFILSLEFIICSIKGWTVVSPEYLLDCQILVVLYAVLTIIMHRQNIMRLIHGEESRFSIHGSKNKAAEEEPQENQKDSHTEEDTKENKNDPDTEEAADDRTGQNTASKPAKKKKKHKKKKSKNKKKKR